MVENYMIWWLMKVADIANKEAEGETRDNRIHRTVRRELMRLTEKHLWLLWCLLGTPKWYTKNLKIIHSITCTGFTSINQDYSSARRRERKIVQFVNRNRELTSYNTILACRYNTTKWIFNECHVSCMHAINGSQ